MKMLANARVGALQTDFGKLREELRLRLQQEINPNAMLEKMRGARASGRKENGESAETMYAERFCIITWDGFVKTRMYRDDVCYLKGLEKKQANDQVRAGEQKKTEVFVVTDIYRAVRMYKHMREGYRDELKGVKTIIAIEQMNVLLNGISADMNNETISEILGRMEKMIKRLKRKTSATKVLALAKLVHAKEKLEESVGEANAGKRSLLIANACALLVAFRNRHFEWRMKEVLRRGSRTALREYSLRARRDEFMHNTLQELIETIRLGNGAAFARREFWKKDREAVKILDGVSKENVVDRVARLGEADVTRGRNFISAAKNWLAKDDKENALKELNMLRLYLCMNKPKYMANEIEKTGDIYLCSAVAPDKTFIAYLRSGARLFEQGVFPRAQYCFEMAYAMLCRD